MDYYNQGVILFAVGVNFIVAYYHLTGIKRNIASHGNALAASFQPVFFSFEIAG